jgi:D-arabinitol 4-dehydrogenase
VAMDAYSKIPGFLAPTVRERLAKNASIASVAMLPALFLAFLHRWHRNEIPYTYHDQAMDPGAAHAICEAGDPVDAFCRDTVLWGPLASDSRLIGGIRAASERVATFVREHRR